MFIAPDIQHVLRLKDEPQQFTAYPVNILSNCKTLFKDSFSSFGDHLGALSRRFIIITYWG
ncbi:MAG: hypothetical protein ACSLEL_05015 [Candidatus Malihini olakiniferum]